MKPIALVCGLGLLYSCASPTNDNPISQALTSKVPEIQQVVTDLDAYEVQIQLSQILRDQNKVSYKNYSFQVNDSLYFYPASTVKLPVSILTLEKLNTRPHLSVDTPFFIEQDSTETTFREDIRDIFAVSSNPTYNRMFEFLGQDAINNSLKEKGIEPVRISHRLSTDQAYELQTKALIFSINDSTLVPTKPLISKPTDSLKIKKLQKGIAYYKDSILKKEPMDFSMKNYYPLSSLHHTMQRLITPQYFKASERFAISESQRQWLIEIMRITPRALDYDPKTYYDSYVKFLLVGDRKAPIPPHLKIHNKVGYAYGYLTDCAYIKDSQTGLEYILSATIHVNKNKIYNDNTYEYETVGIPFLAALGREIHAILNASL